MKNKNIMVVIAHRDDEIFISGALKKWSNPKLNNNIYVVVLCDYSLDHTTDIRHKRRESFYYVMNDMKVKDFTVLSNRDLISQSDEVTLAMNTYEIECAIEEIVENHNIEITTVITMDDSDIHSDHRRVHEISSVIFRKFKNIREMYTMNILHSTQKLDKFNVFIDISNFIKTKKKYIKQYKGVLNEQLSLKNIINMDKHFGNKIGTRAAEILYLKYKKM
jgi:LmbE family N-acetylglucosaminyl deacetylase